MKIEELVTITIDVPHWKETHTFRRTSNFRTFWFFKTMQSIIDDRKYANRLVSIEQIKRDFFRKVK